jgi:hypothetical protein
MNYPHTCNGRRWRFNTTPSDCVISRTGLVLCFFGLAVAPASAADNVATYKKLSLQELMDLEIISVSRRPEKLSDTACAIQDDLDRIEVIRGFGSALWGANAVNGVIAITSKSAKDTQGLFTEVATGTELRNLTNVRYGGALAPNIIFESTENIPNATAAFWRDGSDSSTGTLIPLFLRKDRMALLKALDFAQMRTNSRCELGGRT